MPKSTMMPEDRVHVQALPRQEERGEDAEERQRQRGQEKKGSTNDSNWTPRTRYRSTITSANVRSSGDMLSFRAEASSDLACGLAARTRRRAASVVLRVPGVAGKRTDAASALSARASAVGHPDSITRATSERRTKPPVGVRILMLPTVSAPAGPSSASMTRTSCSLPSRSIRVATTPSRPARAAHARDATSTPLRAMACLSGMM